MLKIAIVGNIAAGKTSVEKILDSKGFKIFDTDKIAHEILAKSEEIKETFGTTDRKEIAKIVFTNPDKMKVLESIIHPKVKNKLEEIFSMDYKSVFVSVPQLFEAGFETLFDKIIYVTADIDIRKKRLMARNSLNEEEALIRIKAQKENGKSEKCDFVIQNNGSLEELEKKVDDVLSILVG